MDKYLSQFGIMADEMFVRADTFWEAVSNALPDLQTPLPILKLAAFMMVFSFISSFLPMWIALIIATIAMIGVVLTFFDFKPKQWSGASAQREYQHSWMSRLFLVWLILSTVLSSFLGEEYADSVFIAHIIVIVYPLGVILGIIGFSAQAQLQGSYGHHDPRYRPLSRHED